MDYKITNHIPILTFWLAVIGVLYLGQVPEYIDAPPFSTHAWRQADGAAQYYHFYNSDLPPWKPKVFNLTAKEGHVISEFPITYWLAGQWAKIFGYQDAWLRAFHLLIFLIGLYYLRKICLIYIRDPWLASVPPLLYLASPPVLYYAFSSLPNMPAIGLVLLAWSLYFSSLKTGKLNVFRYAFISLWFLLATLLKASEGIHFVAFLGVEFLRLTNWIKWPNKNTMPKRARLQLGLKLLALSAFFFLCVFAYNYYVYNFNHHYGNSLNLQGILPIWEESLDSIPNRLIYLDKVFRRIFINDFTTYFLLILFVWLLAKKRTWRSPIGVTSLLLFLGSLCYCILFFGAFTMHDYYYLTLGPFMVFIPIAVFDGLPKFSTWPRYAIIATTLILIYTLGGSMDFLGRKLGGRYVKQSTYLPSPTLNDKAHLLREAGISSNDPMILFGDISPNVGLYYLKQMGWTTYAPRNTFKRLLPYRKRGLKYVCFTGPSAKAKYPDLEPELGALVLSIDSCSIYKLKELD